MSKKQNFQINFSTSFFLEPLDNLIQKLQDLSNEKKILTGKLILVFLYFGNIWHWVDFNYVSLFDGKPMHLRAESLSKFMLFSPLHYAAIQCWTCCWFSKCL